MQQYRFGQSYETFDDVCPILYLLFGILLLFVVYKLFQDFMRYDDGYNESYNNVSYIDSVGYADSENETGLDLISHPN